MLREIYSGNTVAFTVTPTIDGEAQELDGSTSVHFVLKRKCSDPDSEALINERSMTGRFLLTAAMTALPAGSYWYEFRWHASDARYTLEMGTVKFVKTVYD